MEHYNVTGMSCAACQARVEKTVSALPGVTDCAVSLLTNSMTVDGTATADEIISAVEAAGYGASVRGKESTGNSNSDDRYDALTDKETPKMKKRLFWSVVLLLPLMYVSMGHMMWNWPIPAFAEGNHVAMGIYQLLLTAMIMVINQKFFISGFKGLIHRAPNMDTLVALGATASFGYSVYALFAMTNAQMLGDSEGVMHYMHEFYFESAAMILTLITVGKMLEARSKGKTTDALKSLMELAPKTATILVNDSEKVVDISKVKEGDIFLVRPGESIPVDGVIIEGDSAINEAVLTGESIPADKTVGDEVSAATINTSGFLKCKATRVGEDTTLSQIIQMVSDAAATKAPIAKVADRVSGVFVPAVITIAVITIVIWLIAGYSAGFALARGISVLVISCPCALGLATPVAIMVGSGKGAKNGIMFKTALSLEETGKADIVVFDKTGTVTRGEPEVTDIICSDHISEKELLSLAMSLERKSEHPLAKAIVALCNEREIKGEDVEEFTALPGNGLKGRLVASAVSSNENMIYGGNLKYIETVVSVPDDIRSKAEKLAEQGKTPLFFSDSKSLSGIIAVADVIKDDSRQAVSQLKNMGIRTVMLTGDNVKTAEAIASQAGVDEVIAGVLPDGKERVISRLKKIGKVIMVGDGINDAPALTSAHMGVAIGAGTDIAIDAADVVLMKSRLKDVPTAIRLSRATLRNIHENLFWAFFYNVIGIPLAAGLYYPIFGWSLNPMFGAAAMSLSSFCVVTNALRLNLFSLYDETKDKKGRRKTAVNITNIKEKEEKETETMEKTMKINGMMCGHCEAAVKKALEGLAEVDEATVSHENGTAVVKLNKELSDDVLKTTVEEKDYEVVSIM